MGDLFKTGIRPAVDAYLLAEAAKERNYGNYWSASSAGYCMRKNIFERLGVPHSTPDDPRKQRVFSAGHIFHNWLQQLTKDAGLSIAQEVELQDEGLMVRGHFDDLILIPSTSAVRGLDEAVTNPPEPEVAGSIPASGQRLILYDYKTVNSRSFLWAKKNGNAMSYYHRYQLGTYMYMLRAGWGGTKLGGQDMSKLSEARILKIEKDSLMMGEQQLMWDADLKVEVLKYWSDLNTYWANKKIPPCTCADHGNGFLAKEAYNPFFYEDEPCSGAWYEKCKKEGLLK